MNAIELVASFYTTYIKLAKKIGANKQEFVRHWNEVHSQSERPFLPNSYSV